MNTSTVLLSSSNPIPFRIGASDSGQTGQTGHTDPCASAGESGSSGSTGSTGSTEASAPAAIVVAASADYHHVTRRPRPDRDDLAAVTGHPVTVLVHSSDACGASSLQAHEGALYRAGGHRIGLSPRGAQRRGWILDPTQVLDLEPGHDRTGLLRARVQQVRASLPAVEDLSRQHLRALPRRARRPVPIGLAVFATWYAGPSTSPGAIWLLHSYLPEDDIAEGYLLLRPGPGISEHGTIFGKHLLRTGARILHPPKLRLADALTLADLPYHQVLARFVPGHPAPR
jgi:hypothetical protein